jgi:hypothetical protein
VAPGGVLLAPLLAAHELRRRSLNRAQKPTPVPAAAERLSIAAASAR